MEAWLCSFKKEKEIESTRGEKKKNSVHFKSCLKFAARVQITLKHVHGIEWLICIKKKKGGRMKGGQGGETKGNFWS